MGGIQLLRRGGSGTLITVDSVGTFDPKAGASSQYGYSNAGNSITGVAFGAVAPATLLGATINAIYSLDDTVVAGTFSLILNGNQTSLSITSVILYGSTISLGAPSFSGGQTTWGGSMPSIGSTFWATSPVNMEIRG